MLSVKPKRVLFLLVFNCRGYIMLCSISCYSIYLENKQIKVFPVGFDAKREAISFSNAVQFILDGRKSGLNYTLESFGISGIGALVRI